MARFWGGIVLRLVLACVFGLLFAKGLQWSGIETDKAILKIAAHVACWGGFVLSFFIRGAALPRLDYGPVGDQPSGLLDFLQEDSDHGRHP